MEKELLFISVIGQDRVGIVARIATVLYRAGINIEDISQKIMDNYFVMVMLVDIKKANCSLEKINTRLQNLARKLNLSIQIQHENIFKMMHRI